MSRLLMQLLAHRYRSPEPGDDGSGAPAPAPAAPAPAPAAAPAPTEAPAPAASRYVPPPPPEPVIEPSAEVLKEEGISRDDFARLPPEEQKALMATIEHEDTPWEELQRLSAERDSGRAPAPAPAAPAPPAPAPAVAAPAPAAPAPAPGAPAPAPAAAPAAAAPAQWRASPENFLDLPEVAMAPAPQPRVSAEDGKKLTDAKAALEDLETKYEDGALTLEEYRAQRAPHRETVTSLEGALAADQAAQQIHAANYGEVFGRMVRASIETAKKAGIDYDKDADKLKELDTSVQRFAKAAPLMNPGKGPAYWDRWALEQGHKEVGAKYGIKFEAAAPGPAPGPAAPAPIAARKAPDLSLLPPTTRGAPPAADPTIAGGEFSHLDGLSHADLEKQVAMMKPDVLDRYLDR